VGAPGGGGGHLADGPAAAQPDRLHPGTVPFGWVAVVVQQLWPLFLVLVAILLWVFPDGKLPGGRWRRPSVILVVAGLLLGGAESLSGVVRVARHDVRITATGDLVGSAGPVFVFLAFAVVVLSLIAWLPGWRSRFAPTAGPTASAVSSSSGCTAGRPSR
jgi:hypothetical protein